MQEADSICPVPLSSFSHQIGKCSYLAANLRRRDGLLVNENYATMVSPFFRPGFQQWRNCSPVVGNQGQTLRSSAFQTCGVVPPQELTVFPFKHEMDGQQSVATAEAFSNTRCYVLIEQKLEHLAISLLAWNRVFWLAAACA